MKQMKQCFINCRLNTNNLCIYKIYLAGQGGDLMDYSRILDGSGTKTNFRSHTASR